MEVGYDKAALQEYMNQIETIGEQMRRRQDEGLNLYNSCKQQYYRIYTKLEEVARRAYNQVENAESMRRSAEIEYETAKRTSENAESEDVINAAMQRMQQAQITQAEVEEECSKAYAAYSKASGDLKNLSDLWAENTPALESNAHLIEDGLASFSRLVTNSNRDLGEYMSFMDKAHAELYGDSGVKISSSIDSAFSGNATGTVETQGSKRNNTQGATGSSFISKLGNTIGIVSTANALKTICMSVGGITQTYPNTKSGFAKAYRNALKAGDSELASYASQMYYGTVPPNESSTSGGSISARKAIDSDKSASSYAVANLETPSTSAEKWLGNYPKADTWNTESMPLVRANIRRSVELYFSHYVSEDKLERCLEALSFMDQDELARLYGRGFQRGTLGFNDGDTSNIACDIKGATSDGRVGDKTVSGSGNININYAFVTAVHENLHMMSANDTTGVIKRGIMVGRDEKSRAMNEAFTEYFTFLSCGGDTPLGGLYPGVYSGYQILMQEMPTIERAIGRDCMMDAYFNNNPQRLKEAIDRLLEPGAWDDMCTASYDLLYHDNANGAAARLVDYFERLSGV